MAEEHQIPDQRSIRARVRSRIRREKASAEDEEHTRGELNLVPYMDILVNTIIFLLATTASALPLAHITTKAPKEVPDEQVETRPDAQTPGQRLKLTVAVGYKGFIVAGAGGVMEGDDGNLPTIRCRLPLRGERCPAFSSVRGGERRWIDGYDYERLTHLAKQIKGQHPDQRQVVLTADRRVPYRVVIRTMDALRGRPSATCRGDDGCLFDRVIFSAGVR
jgi:biopolymer transport protein TolR